MKKNKSFLWVTKSDIVNKCFFRMPVMKVKKVNGEIAKNADCLLYGERSFG